MANDVLPACLLLLCFVSVAYAINLKMTTDCHVRQYTFRADKSIIGSDGSVMLPCWDDITVFSCWGRCDTSEIPDYKIPYKISYHTICTYGEVKTRIVQLSHCHPRHPDNRYKVIDAVTCNCQVCDPDYTSCENLNG